MQKIKYQYCISSEYNKEIDIQINKIETLVPTILDNLLKINTIIDNTCFFGLEFKTLSFDILFTDDDKIHQINKEYRNKDMPTDVITFALFADDDFKIVTNDDIYLGEIIISLDTAKKQMKTTLQEEILTLIAHGILHLFGFDHQTEEDYNFITGVQDRIINILKEV